MTFRDADYQKLFRYGLVLAGTEDDAFELLHQALEKFMRVSAPIENPVAYVRRIMKNLYIDQQRHLQRFPHIEYEAEVLDPVFSLEQQSLEDFMVTRQEFQDCWRLMTVDEREMLFLFVIEGYTAQEIADEQGVARGTLLSKMHRLKARLKRQVAEAPPSRKAF